MEFVSILMLKSIEICNQPEYGSDGDDMLDDVIEYLKENEEEEE